MPSDLSAEDIRQISIIAVKPAVDLIEEKLRRFEDKLDSQHEIDVAKTAAIIRRLNRLEEDVTELKTVKMKLLWIGGILAAIASLAFSLLKELVIRWFK